MSNDFGDDENALELTVVVATHSEYSRTHCTVHFKWANCTVCELHLNTAVILKSKWLFNLQIADFKCSVFTLGYSGFARFQNKQDNRVKVYFIGIYAWHSSSK